MHEQPAAARLVEAFANTIDVELDTDDLSTPEQLADWLVQHRLLAAPRPTDPADHVLALRLRAGLRERLGVPVGDRPAPELLAEAEQALRALPLLATVTLPTDDGGTAGRATTGGPAAGGAAADRAAAGAATDGGTAGGPTSPTGPHLHPHPDLPPVRRGLAAVAAAWSEVVITGDAARLKRCAEHGCAWVFWDVSKNRSRRWCSMRVCGNRNKARRFAAKRSTERTPAAPAG
ncbi:CGNR zinc finger domain-containing protein [Streptomyces sp. 796.1]|uniref:CGNR zinc finger domain-containing protein n=1 Tax=Streptomyces sp. 796.1 TaxID=3163029 RepID=UPI0039C9093A